VYRYPELNRVAWTFKMAAVTWRVCLLLRWDFMGFKRLPELMAKPSMASRCTGSVTHSHMVGHATRFVSEGNLGIQGGSLEHGCQIGQCIVELFFLYQGNIASITITSSPTLRLVGWPEVCLKTARLVVVVIVCSEAEASSLFTGCTCNIIFMIA
jgi:hypothetical protein